MAEVVGLVVGFAGLAGLFSTCVDCFKLVQIRRSRGADFDTYQTMLDNQLFHLMAWGLACGLMESSDPDGRFEDPLQATRNERIENTLECIRVHISNAERLRDRHGMRQYRPAQGALLELEGANRSPFRRAFEGTKDFWNTILQRQSRFTGSIYWAVHDKEKFCAFIGELQTLIEDLERFMNDAGSLRQQRLIVDYEMTIIDDEASLEAIAEITSAFHGDDTISSAARKRLAQVEERSVITSVLQPDDSVSMISRRVPGSLRAVSPGSKISTNFANDHGDANVEQSIEVLWVDEEKWRIVKPKQGLLRHLPVLFAARSASEYDMATEGGLGAEGTGIEDVEQHSGRLHATRLAINSKILLDEIRRATGLALRARQNVLVHPFKALIVHEKKIKSALAKAKRACAADDRSAMPEKDEPSQTGEVDDFVDADQPIASQRLRLRVRDELTCLVEFIDKEVLPSVPCVDASEKTEITFNQLWQLFWNSDVVYDARTSQAYMLLKLEGGRRVLDVSNYSKSRSDNSSESMIRTTDGETHTIADFVIWCAYLDCDGAKAGPVPHNFSVKHFEGRRPLLDLPCIPLKHCADHEEILKTLENRGAVFLASMRMGQYSYSGPPLTDFAPGHAIDCSRCRQNPRLAELCNSVVRIDHATAQAQLAEEGCSWRVQIQDIEQSVRRGRGDNRDTFESILCSEPLCRTCTDIFDDAGFDGMILGNTTSKFRRILESQAIDRVLDTCVSQITIFCPRRVCAYSLEHHTWIPLDVGRLRVIEADTSALENVNVSQTDKAIISALMPQRSPKSRISMNQHAPRSDFRSQMHSRFVVFHGPPAVGKSFAAEALSTACGLSLMRLAVDELGADSDEAWARLSRYLYLATRWRCIIELEDASNSSRAKQTPRRAVTRVLDRFEGPVILTTCLLGWVDDDIATRVTLAVEFDQLNSEMVKRMCLFHFARVRTQANFEMKVNLDNLDLGKILTGREVRDLVFSAMSLAESEAAHDGLDETPCVKTEHLQEILVSRARFIAKLEETPFGERKGR